MFAVIMALFLTACSPSQGRAVDYCERLAADQSNIVNDEMSQSEKDETIKRRRADFTKNWSILSELLKTGQFLPPEKDSCMAEMILVTLVHTVQTNPEWVFRKSTIDHLAKEVEKENLKLNYLEVTVAAFQLFMPEEKRCKELEEMFEYALVAWKMEGIWDDSKYGPLGEVEYTDCE